MVFGGIDKKKYFGANLWQIYNTNNISIIREEQDLRPLIKSDGSNLTAPRYIVWVNLNRKLVASLRICGKTRCSDPTTKSPWSSGSDHAQSMKNQYALRVFHAETQSNKGYNLCWAHPLNSAKSQSDSWPCVWLYLIRLIKNPVWYTDLIYTREHQ